MFVALERIRVEVEAARVATPNTNVVVSRNHRLIMQTCTEIKRLVKELEYMCLAGGSKD